MPNRAGKLLWDIRDSAEAIAEFTAGRSWEDYQADQSFRRAVEREFSAIGTAMSRMSRETPETVTKVSNVDEFIGLKSNPVLKYDRVRDDSIWQTVTKALPQLLKEVEGLLAQPTT